MDKDILEENIQTAITRMTPNLCEELLVQPTAADQAPAQSCGPCFSLKNRLAAFTAQMYLSH